jgi:hypothetical protein
MRCARPTFAGAANAGGRGAGVSVREKARGESQKREPSGAAGKSFVALPLRESNGARGQAPRRLLRSPRQNGTRAAHPYQVSKPSLRVAVSAKCSSPRSESSIQPLAAIRLHHPDKLNGEWHQHTAIHHAAATPSMLYKLVYIPVRISPSGGNDMS